MERAIVEYIANALWQIPLLAGGAWLFLWAVRPGPRMQHWVWLAALGLAVALPMHGMGSADGFTNQTQIVGVSPVVGPVFDTVLVPRQQELSSEDVARPLVKKNAVRKDWFVIAPRVHSVYLAASTVDWLVGAYVAAIFFGVFRVARAWRTAQHLVESARETTLREREMALLKGYGERLRIRLPEVRESCAVASPMIVGVVAPVLLLPEGFWRHTEDEVRAALFHELAHVKRRDYLVNLICQVVALPVSWHPVTYGVQRRIRRTREMVCDAMAAREMQSEIGYARCLLAMARSMLGGKGMVEQAQGLGLFGNNILEERVMRLMETKTAMSVRAKVARAASGATMMIAATAMATMFHVSPTMAQQNTVAEMGDSQSVLAVAQSLPAAPVVSVAEPAPPPEPAPQSVPAPVSAPPEPAAPAPAPPASAVAPAAHPAPAALSAQDGNGQVIGQEGITVRTEKDAEGKPFVIVNGERRELTPEEKSRLDKQMAIARKQIAEATAKLNSPEFKKQIADAEKQAATAAAQMNSDEFKQQMAAAQKQVAEATAKFNSPEFKEQMAEAGRQNLAAKDFLNSPEFRKQIEDAQRQSALAKDMVNSPEFKRQMDEAHKQMAEAMAKLNSPEFRQQMADAQKQMAETQIINSTELRRQMEEMQRDLEEAMRKLNETKSHAGETQVK